MRSRQDKGGRKNRRKKKESIMPEELSPRFGYLPRTVGSIEAEFRNHLKVNIRSTNEPILTRRRKKVVEGKSNSIE